jgi:hypothetical protein
MPEEKSVPDGDKKPYVGYVFCSFCDGYERQDGETMNIFPFPFSYVGIPVDKTFVICPKCFVRAFEKILGREAKLIDRAELLFDWSLAPKL